MDVTLTIAAIGSFFGLVVAWVALPHSATRATAARSVELQPAAQGA